MKSVKVFTYSYNKNLNIFSYIYHSISTTKYTPKIYASSTIVKILIKKGDDIDNISTVLASFRADSQDRLDFCVLLENSLAE